MAITIVVCRLAFGAVDRRLLNKNAIILFPYACHAAFGVLILVEVGLVVLITSVNSTWMLPILVVYAFISIIAFIWLVWIAFSHRMVIDSERLILYSSSKKRKKIIEYGLLNCKLIAGGRYVLISSEIERIRVVVSITDRGINTLIRKIQNATLINKNIGLTDE